MIEHVKKRIPHATLKRRQQEIEQCLAVFGLARGPRRLLRDTSAEGYEKTHSRRLRAALENLGPVFSSFGLYLSSRVDLFPAKDCLELAAIPDRAAVTRFTAVRALLSREFGCSLESAYMAFEEEPFESRLLLQSHHAWLSDGTAVTVKLTHPEAEEQFLCDLELLPLLREAFADREWNTSGIESVMADFCQTLRQQTDLAGEARAFEMLAQDAEGFEMIKSPIVQRNLSTSKVLTVERLSGFSLDNVISSFNERGEVPAASAVHESAGLNREELARLLCLVWLRQTFLGLIFPVEPHSKNVVILPNRQLAFTGGTFASLHPEPKTNLWNYMIAAASENPDEACSCLLREMRRERDPNSQDELRQRFRQVVPFRDGGWNSAGDSQSLAGHLFAQWRLASEYGYLFQAHLPSFCRGLYVIADMARRLAPARDSLLEGLRDLRLIAGLAQFQEMLNFRQMSDQMDKYAAMMVQLPQSLDEMLTLAAEGKTRLKLHVPATAEHYRQKNSSVVVIAWLLILAAVVLLSHKVAASAAAGAWAERIGTIIFMLCGAMLLRAASRVR